MSTILSTHDINKSYGDLRVLKDLSLDVKQGEFLAITGPSGSGKSTLLHIMGGLERPDTGHVQFKGKDLPKSEKALNRLRNLEIGFVFQFHHLLPEFTALENICMPAWIAGDKDPEARGKELARKFGLGDRLDHLPNALSGGEQQRVAVVRALMQNPSILLADEPSGNLDHALSESLFDLLDQARNEEGVTVVVVTHSQTWAKRADRQLHLVDGEWAP